MLPTAPSAEGYTITTPRASEFAIVIQDEFGDGSYSVRFHVTALAAAGAACLGIAETPEGSYHQFCALYDTETQAAGTFDYIAATYLTPDGFEATGDWEIAPVDAAGWHKLKAIASGGAYWVLFDGALVGSFTHEASTTGLIGFSAVNFEGLDEESSPTEQLRSVLASRTPTQAGTDSQIEFTDLTVRMLQS